MMKTDQPVLVGRNGTVPVAAPQRRIKDAPTRAAHWWMVLAFAGAYATGDSESWRLWHVIFGYSLLLALAFRLLWGVWGPQPVRLSLWWRRGKAGAQWLATQINPAQWRIWLQQPQMQLKQSSVQGTGLVLLLMVLIMPFLGGSGYVAYQEWTGDWMGELHEWLGNLALTAVLVHLGLLLAGSLLRRQNLAWPMVTGKTPGTGPDLLPYNRLWLALLFSAAVIGFAAWYWQDTVP